MDGWLNLYKPLNISSAQLVARVKKVVGRDVKVGHCGTLDPLADGVLPIAIGQATKLSDCMLGSAKSYIFTIQFGARTATGDAEGEVIERCGFVPDSVDSLENVVQEFLGKTMQCAPKYSALKIGGVPSYKLARLGLPVAEKIREIEIFSLKLLDCDIAAATATYQVHCSKGTYVRSLAEDIASSLKSLGFVIRLSRVSVKNFNGASSLSGDCLVNSSGDDALSKIKENLLPVEYILQEIPFVDLNEEDALRVRQGKKILIHQNNLSLVWLRYKKRILSIGSLFNKEYNIFRNFNLEDLEDVDNTTT
jgi:tRNA pseudouridine55 synthase